MIVAVAMLALLPRSAPLAAAERKVMQPGNQAPIGSARMLDDGTIVLDLRAEGPKGTLGDMRLVYAKSHKDYAMVFKHLGGLKPGETKPVPPWPEAKDRKSGKR
jgi:hypothetical protein